MIKQEDFDKLKQNDRIELLLRENRLKERKDNLYFDWIGLLWIFFGVIGFIILLSLQLKILGLEESFIRIFSLIIPIIKIMIIVGVFGVCWNLMASFIIFPKWEEKLESYFFKKQIKNKK